MPQYVALTDGPTEGPLEPATPPSPPFGYCDSDSEHDRHVHTGIDQLPWECPGWTAAQVAAQVADEADYWAWQQDDCEPTPRAFCDNYEVHEAHSYWAINRNMYQCGGFTAGDLADAEAEAARPPCEHGLSASLCGGPMHWYD
jgi:hypothetical protein